MSGKHKKMKKNMNQYIVIYKVWKMKIEKNDAKVTNPVITMTL
jgi:hypothetical protein